MDKNSKEYLISRVENLNQIVNVEVLTSYGLGFNNENVVDIVSGGEKTKEKVQLSYPSKVSDFASLLISVNEIVKDFPYIIPEFYGVDGDKIVLEEKAYDVYNGYIGFYKFNPESVTLYNAANRFLKEWESFKEFVESNGGDALRLISMENEPSVNYSTIKGYYDFMASKNLGIVKYHGK